MGHLTFVPKRLSAVGNKRISEFFDSASEPRSRVIALVDSTWVFLLLSFYIVFSWNMPLFKAWSEDKLNKKFVVAENFAKLASRGNVPVNSKTAHPPPGQTPGHLTFLKDFGQIPRYVAVLTVKCPTR